jgi:hypothetical protein
VFGTSQEEPRGGAPEGVILLLFAIITVAISAYVLLSSEQDAKTDPVQKAARGEIQGLDPQSMLREANLRRALSKLADGSRPFLISLRVSATKVDVTARDADGSRKVISVDTAFDLKESDFGVGDDKAVRPSVIDASGPERMARAVGERTRLGPDAIDYVALSATGTGERTWYMSLDQGPARVRQWVASADGTDVRKPGELSQKQKDANAKTQRDIRRRNERLRRNLVRRNTCLIKARDAAASARCIQRFPL